MAMSFGETDSDMRMSRPFGVSLLVAGVEKFEGKVRPRLFHTDPSVTYVQYDAKAIGTFNFNTLAGVTLLTLSPAFDSHTYTHAHTHNVEC